MIKFRYDPNPSIARLNQGKYEHRFGGKPVHEGVIPRKCDVPMHLILNLDMNDALVPIEPEDSDLRFLPLYYPLRYGFGGGEVQYSVDGNDRITILSDLHKLGEDEGDEFPFPDYFPEHPLTLEPLDYVKYRAVIASENGTNHHIDDPEKIVDRHLLKELDSEHMFRFGDSFSPIQGGICWPCQNRKCKWKGKHVRVDVFAQLAPSIKKDIPLWSEDEDGPEIYFCLMSCCNTITTVNRCT